MGGGVPIPKGEELDPLLFRLVADRWNVWGGGGSNEKHANNNHAAVFHVQEDGHLLHVQLDDGTVRAFLLAVERKEHGYLFTRADLR